MSRNLNDTVYVLKSGLVYILGRMSVYVLVGFILVKGLLSAPIVSLFLQRHANQVLAPLLIIVGMFLLGLLNLDFLSFSPKFATRKFSGKPGTSSAFFMGMVFALSFCPLSAALYFGSLVPLAAKHNSSILLPSLFGLGSGVPVAVFAILIATGLKSAGKFFNAASAIEKWARKATGGIFILAGVHLSLKYIFNVF